MHQLSFFSVIVYVRQFVFFSSELDGGALKKKQGRNNLFIITVRKHTLIIFSSDMSFRFQSDGEKWVVELRREGVGDD